MNFKLHMIFLLCLNYNNLQFSVAEGCNPEYDIFDNTSYTNILKLQWNKECDDQFNVTYCWKPDDSLSIRYCNIKTMGGAKDSGCKITGNKVLAIGCIDNLHLNTSYQVDIGSKILSYKTLPIKLDYIIEVQIDDTFHNSIDLSWTTNATVDMFQIHYCSDVCNRTNETKSTIRLHHLKHNTTYYIIVEGISLTNNIGISTGSRIISVRTGILPPTTTTVLIPDYPKTNNKEDTSTPSNKSSPNVEDTSNAAVYASVSILFVLLLLGGIGYIIYAKRKSRMDGEYRNVNVQVSNLGTTDSNFDSTSNIALINLPQDPSDSSDIPKGNSFVEAGKRMMEAIYSSPMKNRNIITKVMKVIELNELLNTLKNENFENTLDEEHAQITSKESPTQPQYGENLSNKNRHRNILPNSANRVKLKVFKKFPNSDYINASYINGYKKSNKYIATQGPISNTIDDFWRMIWEQNVKTIVMVTSLKEGNTEKCYQYWPDDNQTAHYYTITVHCFNKEICTDFQIRSFSLKRGNEERTVTHMYFDTWPDNVAPYAPHSMISFIRRLRKLEQNNSPIVVHCSAGVGRTGTIIMCDIMIDMARDIQQVDFAKCLVDLRSSRKHMISKPILYKLAHCVVLEYITGKETSIMMANLSKGSDCPATIKYLQSTRYWNNNLLQEDTHPFIQQNEDKNRVSKPEKSGVGYIYLDRLTGDDNSDYINAVRIYGIREKDKYISTIQPLPNTVGDFWRLVDKMQSTVILCLHEINENDPTSTIFWPAEDEVLEPVDHIQLRQKTQEDYGSFEIIKLHIRNTNSQEVRDVHILKYKNWNNNEEPKIDEFLRFYNYYTENKYSERESNVLACYDGSSGCGLFLTFDFIIRKVMLEKMFDFCWAVRILKQYRENFMMNEVQYKWVYEATKMYVAHYNTENIYENITTHVYGEYANIMYKTKT